MALKDYKPAKPKLQYQQYSLRFRREVYEQLVAVADEHGMSLAQAVHALVTQEYLKLFEDESCTQQS